MMDGLAIALGCAGLALAWWLLHCAEARETRLLARIADLERNLGLALQSKSTQDYAARVAEDAHARSKPDPDLPPTLEEQEQAQRKQRHVDRMGWAQRRV